MQGWSLTVTVEILALGVSVDANVGTEADGFASPTDEERCISLCDFAKAIQKRASWIWTSKLNPGVNPYYNSIYN